MENILNADEAEASAPVHMTAIALYDKLVGLAAAGTYIAWEYLSELLRAEAEHHTGCARRKRIDRALDCESRALARRTAAAFRAEQGSAS